MCFRQTKLINLTNRAHSASAHVCHLVNEFSVVFLS